MKIFLVGMPGSGKTKVGRALGERTGLPFYDLDEFITHREGRSINEIFEKDGEGYFREMERRCLRELIGSHSALVLATGGGAPCFHDNMVYMNGAGITVFLDVPVCEIAERMAKKGTKKRPLLKDIDKSDLQEELEVKYSRRRRYYAQAAITIGDGLGMVDRRVDRIVEEIRDLEQ